MNVHRCGTYECIMTITARMKNYLEQLMACVPIGMDTRAERNMLHQIVPQQGVYVFYKGCIAVYVGRSDGMSNRILQHGRPGESRTSTPVATKIAREEMAQPFDAALPIAREMVRAMQVRVVEIQCPNDQAIFEIYAHIALGYTRYNDFENR